jgi:alcohol dehydrogenase class IV
MRLALPSSTARSSPCRANPPLRRSSRARLSPPSWTVNSLSASAAAAPSTPPRPLPLWPRTKAACSTTSRSSARAGPSPAPDITASTGLDALTQLTEAFVCARANPITDGLCREGIERAARALPRVYYDGQDAAAREDMALASLFGGLVLANAGLGAVHGFAGPIGGMFSAPHGAVCAALLPHVMAANVNALRQRRPDAPALARFEEVARMVTGRPDATADDAVAWTRRLCDELVVPPLRAYGVGLGDVPVLVEKAQAASSMKANPLPLTPEELSGILNSAM